jgi:hypothetical protein
MLAKTAGVVRVMPPWLYWCIMVPLYWAAVVHILRDASPVFVDGSGPMPSFNWGKRLPEPTAYAVPYYIGGLIITVLGCGVAPKIARRRPRSGWLTFLIASAAMLTLPLLVSAISDAGGQLRWWSGPRILSDYDPVVLSKALLHPSILSGVVAFGRSII